MEATSSPPRVVHFNKPQLKVGYVDAQETICVWGRGTGKSEGVIAPRALRCIATMPRSVGVFYAASFQQLLTKTLPPILAGWERLDFKQGRDYVFGEKPPSWWPRPRQARLDYRRTFSIRNGAAVMLASQETRGSLNGPSIDWLCGDEIKFWNRERYEGEALQAMRGNFQHYGTNALHHSVLLCTDMPIDTSARWILEKEHEMDNGAVQLILALQTEVFKLRSAISGGVADNTRANYLRQMARLKHDINELRKGTVFYSEASALDNIDALGLSYIARMKKILPPFLFDVTILNKRPDRVEGGFYPGLDTLVHGYVPPTTLYAELLGARKEWEERDCRFDGTLVDTLPIDIACDYGSRFNCMVVGQGFDKRYNIDNCLYVMSPEKLRDLVKKFDAYYSPRKAKCNTVFYHFDHTAIGTNAMSDNTFADEIRIQLSKRGWNVVDMNMGQAPHHHEKYVFWGRLFARDEGMPEVVFNRENCHALLLSMQLAPARQTRLGFEKDKTSERDPNADQSEATHLSDACDQLMWGRCNARPGLTGAAAGAMFG